MTARRSASPVALFLLSASLALTALSADPSRDYRSGMQAQKEGRFEDAVQAFRNAIQSDREEGIRKLRSTGMNFEDYFPYFHLGMSLERLGRTGEAITALEESQRQAAVFERPDLRSRLDGSLSRLRAVPIASRPQSPLPTTALAVPAVPAVTAAPAAPTARPAATAAPRPVATPTPPPTAPPTRTIPPPTRPPLVISTQVPAVAGRAAVLPAAPSAADLAPFRKGLESYFHGRYEEAVAQLRPLAKSSPAAQLFLAYSLTSKALLAKPRDEKVIRAARAEYRSSLARGGKLADPALVPPKVRKLLE